MTTLLSVLFMTKTFENLQTNEIQANFCQYISPLVNQLDLNFVRFVRHYKNGEMSIIANDGKVLDWYFGNNLYTLGYNEQGYDAYQSGFILTDSWEKSPQILENITAPFSKDFNIGSQLILYKKQDDYCDILELSAFVSQYQANSRFMQHLRFIKKFMEGLISSDFIKKHSQKKIRLDIDLNTKIISIINQHGLDKLSPRELQCIYWMGLGKTFLEMGEIMSLSSRSIELYVTNIKKKLGVYTFYQIGEIIGQHKRHFNILFAEMDK